MSYFTQDFLKFFRELEKNNNKEWFDENRKRYEASVKKPFTLFLEEMIGRVSAEDPESNIPVKDAVMRINRDIRFSPDKTPYNTYYGAIISPAGRKDKSMPGLYMNFSTKGVGIYGGLYMLDKDQLHNVRSVIAGDLKAFQKLISNKSFKQKFGEIQGEKNKRIPKEFEEASKAQPLLANKQFYFGTTLAAKLITDDKLPDTLMDYWRTAQPLTLYLRKALAG